MSRLVSLALWYYVAMHMYIYIYIYIYSYIRAPRGEELRRELPDVARLGDEGVRGAGRVLEAGHVDVVLARERASGKGVVKIFDYWRAKKEGDSRDSRGKIRNLPLLLQPLFRCPSPSPAGRTPPGTSRGRTRCRGTLWASCRSARTSATRPFCRRSRGAIRARGYDTSCAARRAGGCGRRIHMWGLNSQFP